jgi:hypothetical protein
MRVNIDEQALAEPRIKRMARKLGKQLGREVHHFEVLGRLTAVWMLCYSRRDPVIRIDDVDITSEIDGFAGVMVDEEMATATEGGDRIYVCGVSERIAFLEKQVERGRKGGKAPRETEAMATQARLFADDEALAKRVHERTLARAEAKAKQTPSVRQANSQAPDQDQAPDLAPDQDHHPRVVDVSETAPIGTEGHGAAPSPSAEKGHPTAKDRAQGKPAREVPDQAVTLGFLLLSHITSNHPSSRIAKAPERVRNETALRWAETIDKIHRLDRMEWGAIEAMITWSQRHTFWRSVILGADNLRDKWDKMQAQRDAPPPQRHDPRGNAVPKRGPTELALEELAELERAERATEGAPSP